MAKKIIISILILCIILVVAVPVSAPGSITAWRSDTTRAIPSDEETSFDVDEAFIYAENIEDEIPNDIEETIEAPEFYIAAIPMGDAIENDTSPPQTDSTITGDANMDNDMERKIDPAKPMVAITFDDGPSQHTPPILDVLERFGAVATFYVTGNRVESHREIVQRAYELGNEIASHTWSHPRLTDLSDDDIRTELRNASNAIESIIGSPPLNMRPPFGAYDERVSSTVAEFGLPIIMWSIDPMDWRTKDADSTYDFVMGNIRHGDIVLMHDLTESTAEAAVRLIPALIRRGYQLVTVTELMQYSGITPGPGVTFKSGAGDVTVHILT